MVISQTRTTRSRRLRPLCTLAIGILSGLSAWTLVCAQTMDIRPISNPSYANRDPAISETGLAAWMSTDTNNPSPFAHISVFSNGELLDLTGELTTSMYGAAKPVIHSNQVIFIASAFSRQGDITWTMREVPTRDEGDQPELTALFEANEAAGTRSSPDETTDAVATNESVVPLVGMSTNAARRRPSGESEIWSWRVGDADIQRVTHDTRNDFAPTVWGETIAWQKARGWPFGWEIMALVGEKRLQLTTNFYYEMGAKAQGDHVVWYGWDGFDYEIFMYDSVKDLTIQITSNRYDDVAPVVWGGVVAWESYAAVESDIFIWKDGEIRNISTNIDDDLYPRIWNGKVVWQGFDGDDYEIYLYDVDKGGEAIKLTSNTYDDVNPRIHDDLIAWMGYHDNWDAEIFYLDIRNLDVANLQPVQLTSNEEDDRDPDTSARRIVWVSELDGTTQIMLAEPR
jgi:hypothetical protein